MTSCPRCSSSNFTHDSRDKRGRVVYACGGCGRHATTESGSTDRALSVKRVFYAGNEAGIVCDVTPSRTATEVLIVSLTHLRTAPHHPLFPAILAYQRERVRRLAAADV
jgi:hypothetical protein